MKQILIIMALLLGGFFSFATFLYASFAMYESCAALSIFFGISALFVPTAFFMLAMEYGAETSK